MKEEGDCTNLDIQRALKTLIRGLTQNNIKEIFEGHKTLYRLGKTAIPYILNAINQSTWSKIKRANEVRYLAGLVSILHDIDEGESIPVVKQLKQGGCDPSIANILDSICRFTLSDYFMHNLRGIPVFEHKNLKVKQSVILKLEDWLRNIPEEDLNGIERLYLLRKCDLNALGNYTPILFSINLVWDNPYSRYNPLSFFNNFIIEHTLYHEIGHHIYQHTFGQIERQEKQANDYATYRLARSNHFIFKFIRAIFGNRSSQYRVKKIDE
jgi:hypothetical protein